MRNTTKTMSRAVVPAMAITLTAAITTGAAGGAPGASPRTATVATRAVASHSVDIRVASWNVLSVGLDKTRGLQLPWRQRRGKVMAEILGEHVDAIGLQEVNQSTTMARRLVAGSTQYLDLRNGLNRRGGHYALTNVNAVDCLNGMSGYRCRYRDRDASAQERILYNTNTLTMVSRDSMKYRRHTAGRAGSYLTWAVFRARATGKTFLFTSTHLEPTNLSVRRAQWQQMISRINQVKGSRPVVSVGDFNTTKYNPVAAQMLPAMRRAGYGDVLNQQYRVNPAPNVRATRRVNGWISSWNKMTRNVRLLGDPNRRTKTGNSLDYIFASNSLPVKEFKVVLDYNPQTLRVNGVLPSDHNLIRATITLR